MLTALEKWHFLQRAPHDDAMNKNLRYLAAHLWAASDHNTRRYILLCMAVARDWITMLPDSDRVEGEDIAGLTRDPQPDDAIDALKRGYDDCDAKARLFIALCLIYGISARMVPYWKRPGQPLTPWGEPTDSLSHVAAEVLEDGKWKPVELTLARAQYGELGSQVPKDSNGRWLLAGN